MDDLISRNAAINALQKEIDKGKPPFDDTIGAIRCGVRLARNIIEDLPSAQPENRRGQWLHVLDTEECEYWECSECGEQWIFEEGRTPYDEEVYYCPNCGADLRGDDQILFVTLQVALKKEEGDGDATD